MGLGGENEPPKKKLKQAQLCFTPKSQKRKLISDVDGDDKVQFVKVIRKESPTEETVNIGDKENHNSLTKHLSHELDKKRKLSSESVETSEKKIGSPNIVDLADDNAFNSPQDVTSLSEQDPDISKNTSDFSLSISDSVIDAINNKLSEGIQDKKIKNEVVDGNKEFGQSSLPTNLENKDESFDSDDENEKEDDNDVVCLSSSADDVTPNKSKGQSLTPRGKHTPKRLDSLKRKEEQQRLKFERKAERARIKEERIRKLEEEKKKKKEEKEQKKFAELKQKEEEKRLRDEEKRKRDEEKRKREEAKEEEKRKREEIELKKKAAFAKFFTISKQPDAGEKIEENEGNNFMPFPMKPDMKLAPQTRRVLKEDEKQYLDSHLMNSKDFNPYLAGLRSGSYIPGKGEATWPVSLVEEDHDVIIIESTTNEDSNDVHNTAIDVKEHKNKIKAKLLQFHDNRRPPYWGTWRKKSKAVGPKRPLGQEKGILDYEVDSDSEWEDEPDGEDIDKEGDSDGDGSGEEEETNTGNGENGYILDNTFVPHGYLSDEEVQPDEDAEDNDPETQKIRMNLLKQEFDEEMKSKTERLKPRLLGCVWISNGTTEVSAGSLYEKLMSYRAVWYEEAGSIDVTGPVVEDSPTATPQTKKIFPRSVLETVVKYVHGCTLPLSAIIKELLILIEKEHPSDHVSKRAVTLKVKEIASKTYDYSTGKPKWSINSALLEEYDLKPFIDTIPPPISQPTLHVVIPEKPKEGPLKTFFKGHPTPPVKKKVPFVTLEKATTYDYTPSKINEKGAVKDFGTPRPVDPVLRKRAQLITLSTNIGNSTSQENTFPLVNETPDNKESPKLSDVIDLCSDSK